MDTNGFDKHKTTTEGTINILVMKLEKLYFCTFNDQSSVCGL